MFVNLIVVFIFTQLNVFQVIMSDFQSSEAILNDLFSSIESKYDTVHTNSENQTNYCICHITVAPSKKI